MREIIPKKIVSYGKVCPICRFKIVQPNIWVKYHISYAPPQVIFACKYCNYVEQLLRTGKPIPYTQHRRIDLVIAFQKKFDIVL